MIGDLVFDTIMGSHGLIVGFIPREKSIRTPWSPKREYFEVHYTDGSIELAKEEDVVWISKK